MERRDFLKASSIATISLVGTKKSKAQKRAPRRESEFVGVLVDTTRCIGCRHCEIACAETHGHEIPDVLRDNALEEQHTTSDKQWTVVNRHDTSKGEFFAKKQCMHCWQPACAAACPTNAMDKTTLGPVIWHPDRCMGCRFCMVSCPFDIPKFEYFSANPRIEKCTLCWKRLQNGQQPACVAGCPSDTLVFGQKARLLEIARQRIYHHPEHYYHQIYGQNIAGGTSYMYLSAVPFDEIGLPTDLGDSPFPAYTKEFLYSVPFIFFGLPSLLIGLNLLAERKKTIEEEGDE